MSDPPAPAPAEPPGLSPAWLRLPRRLQPRPVELPGLGRVRLIETTLLLLGAVLLATATVNDLSREVKINDRLIVDTRMWRTYTRHDYANLSTGLNVFGEAVQRDVVCGNTSPGAPLSRTQLCLAIGGPVVDGRREILGGWYLPPNSEDKRAERYACFGAGAQGMCER
jgi:hypothetical protein